MKLIDSTYQLVDESQLLQKESDKDNKEYVLLDSKLLNEEVVLGLNTSLLDELRRKFPDRVIYFPPEIEELWPYRESREFITKVHSAKRKFGAWIVPSSS
jgi:hypothetical protein